MNINGTNPDAFGEAFSEAMRRYCEMDASLTADLYHSYDMQHHEEIPIVDPANPEAKPTTFYLPPDRVAAGPQTHYKSRTRTDQRARDILDDDHPTVRVRRPAPYVKQREAETA